MLPLLVQGHERGGVQEVPADIRAGYLGAADPRQPRAAAGEVLFGAQVCTDNSELHHTDVQAL